MRPELGNEVCTFLLHAFLYAISAPKCTNAYLIQQVVHLISLLTYCSCNVMKKKYFFNCLWQCNSSDDSDSHSRALNIVQLFFSMMLMGEKHHVIPQFPLWPLHSQAMVLWAWSLTVDHIASLIHMHADRSCCIRVDGQLQYVLPGCLPATFNSGPVWLPAWCLPMINRGQFLGVTTLTVKWRHVVSVSMAADGWKIRDRE